MADVNRIDDTQGDTTHQGTAGADVFEFSPGYTGSDTITGFTNGTDHIDLTRFQGITRFEDLTVTSDGSDVVVDLTGHGGGTIRLTGFDINNLDASDFVFSTLDGGGTTGDDELFADNDGDRIDGGGGTDKLHGGEGSDILIGGTGNDFLDGNAGHDWLEGGEGDDELDGGAGDDVLSGGAGNDTLKGSAGDDILAGHEGSDRLDGGTGDDSLDGGSGADVFVFAHGHGNDVIYDFTSGSDRIDLTAFSEFRDFEDLTITSDDSGVTIDLTTYGGGTILLDGLTMSQLNAQDFVFHNGWEYGTEGDDTFTGMTNDSTSLGKTAADFYDGLGGDDVIHGRGGNDHLRGGAGDDEIDGGAGSDTLEGGAGDDVLDGGTGDDTMWGGTGHDKFVFQSGHGNDTIKDFTDGEDLIDLTELAGITGFGDLTTTADGSDAVINLTSHGGGTIRLENFSVSDLDDSDFRFYEPPVDPGVEGA